MLKIILVTSFIFQSLLFSCKKRTENSKSKVWYEQITGIGPIISFARYKEAFQDHLTCPQRQGVYDRMECETTFFRSVCRFRNAMQIQAHNSTVLKPGDLPNGEPAKNARLIPQPDLSNCDGDPGPLPQATNKGDPQFCVIKDGGEKICFPVGAVIPNLGPPWNDKIVKVETQGGAWARAYEHVGFFGNAIWLKTTGDLPDPWRANVGSLYVINMGAESWTPEGSDEDATSPPVDCQGSLMTAVRCTGRYCDNMVANCARNTRADNAEWGRAFSDESPNNENYFSCPKGKFVTAIRCDGDYCDNMYLQCSTPSNLTPTDECGWSKWFSEENEGGGQTAPAGFYVSGMVCQGDYCDNMQLMWCKANPK